VVIRIVFFYPHIRLTIIIKARAKRINKISYKIRTLYDSIKKDLNIIIFLAD